MRNRWNICELTQQNEILDMNLEGYNALKEYLRHHTPMCSMEVERRMPPNQVTTFRIGNWRQGNSTLIGNVSAITLVNWEPSPDNKFVEVEKDNSTFRVPTIPCECLAKTFDEFYDMMVGDDVLIIGDYKDVRDFDVEYIGKNGFKCSYDDRSFSYSPTRKTEGFKPFQFKEAQLFRSFIRVSYNDENGGYGGLIDIPIRLIAK